MGSHFASLNEQENQSEDVEDMNESEDPDMFSGKGLNIAEEGIEEGMDATLNGGVKNADEI